MACFSLLLGSDQPVGWYYCTISECPFQLVVVAVKLLVVDTERPLQAVVTL